MGACQSVVLRENQLHPGFASSSCKLAREDSGFHAWAKRQRERASQFSPRALQRRRESKAAAAKQAHAESLSTKSTRGNHLAKATNWDHPEFKPIDLPHQVQVAVKPSAEKLPSESVPVPDSELAEYECGSPLTDNDGFVEEWEKKLQALESSPSGMASVPESELIAFEQNSDRPPSLHALEEWERRMLLKQRSGVVPVY